jgi:hypothetical protein
VDRSDSSRVKSDRGHHHRGVAPERAARAANDGAIKDREHPLYRCSGRTYLGNRLSPSDWPIDSQNRWRDRTESSRIHQLLNAPEGKEIPVWLSQLRQLSRGSGGKKKRPESETEIRSGLAREVEMLRRWNFIFGASGRARPSQLCCPHRRPFGTTRAPCRNPGRRRGRNSTTRPSCS